MGKVNSFEVRGQNYDVEADLTFDSVPTLGSTNPVTSNGIAEAINGVRIGTDISYDRATGTPVGYCSISYGQQNAATSNFSVAMGDRNKVYNYASIAMGAGNESKGHNGCNSLFGNGNKITGTSCSDIGASNQIGVRHDGRIDTEYLDEVNKPIYIGYLYTSTGTNKGKLYHDSTYQNEITIPRSTSTYIIDLTKNVGQNRTPGQFYSYTKSSGGTITYEYVDNAYVHLTDYCHNSVFFYNGVCYYNSATDKNYSDSARTSEINVVSEFAYSSVYFDLVNGTLLLYCAGMGSGISHPKWIPVTLYKMGYVYEMPDRTSVIGRQAYIHTDQTVSTNLWHVYRGKEMTASQDITSDICDGEVVMDGLTGGMYKYRFNTDHVLCFVTRIGDSETEPIPYGDSALVLGKTNYTCGGQGCFVAGDGNSVSRASEGSAIIGHGNEVHVGSSGGGMLGSLIAGSNHEINTYGVEAAYMAITGMGNHISDYGVGGPIATSMFGKNNRLYGSNGETNIIIGHGNEGTSLNSHNIISGSNNYLYYTNQSFIYGTYNNIGNFTDKTVTSIVRGDDGIWTGNGVSYNEGVYTFSQNYIFEKHEVQTDNRVNPERMVKKITGYAVASNDGHSLVNISLYDGYGLSVLGNNNTYRKRYGTYNEFNYIIGSYNDVTGTGCSRIGVIGSHLNVDFDGAKSDVIVTGVYNNMDGVGNAVYIVGNGTSSNSAHNGLIVYSTGAVAAPTAPDTISGGESAMSGSGISSDKMLVTYAQLRSYTGPGGGGSSRPVVSSVILESADWSSVPVEEGSTEYTYEQTISFSGISSNSIVIVQPNGPPVSWYTNYVYLHSQDTNELIFRCSTVPSGDISVKVVYWV